MNVALEGRMRSVASSRLRTIAYWAATLLIAAEFGVGGVMDTLHLPPFFAILLHLGYQAYFGVIRGAIGDDALVELASEIAWENYRSRFNRAFDVQAQGYCEAGFCVLPARPGITR